MKRLDTHPPKLSIELVPGTSWGSNLRSSLPKERWDAIRRHTYKQAGYVCEICGGVGPKWPVECHEVWRYDDKKHVQVLGRCIALCPTCHAVKHMGRTRIKGDYPAAIKHLMSVNEWKSGQAERYIAKAFETWNRRSCYEWTLDLTWLEEFDAQSS